MSESTRSYFGHIKRTGHETYRIWWDAPRDPDGKRNQRTVTVHGTRADAETALARARIGLMGADGSCLLRDYWAASVEPTLPDLAAKTSHEYSRLWNRELAPRLGGLPLGSIDRAAAERALNDIESPTVQRAAYRLLKKVLNMAVRDGAIASHPVDRYIRLAPHRKLYKELVEAPDVAAWMDGVRGSKYEPVLLLELGGGLRVEEACALVWHADVSPLAMGGRTYVSADIRRALVPVAGGGRILKATKTEGSERRILVGEPFASRLIELMPEQPAPLCAARPFGGGEAVPEDFTSPVTITHNYRAWCKRRGMRYVCPKNLRSSFATLHGEAGSPDSVVSGIMGHTDGTTKGRNYQRVTLRAMAAAADGLAAYLDGFVTDCYAEQCVSAGQRRVYADL